MAPRTQHQRPSCSGFERLCTPRLPLPRPPCPAGLQCDWPPRGPGDKVAVPARAVCPFHLVSVLSRNGTGPRDVPGSLSGASSGLSLGGAAQGGLPASERRTIRGRVTAWIAVAVFLPMQLGFPLRDALYACDCECVETTKRVSPGSRSHSDVEPYGAVLRFVSIWVQGASRVFSRPEKIGGAEPPQAERPCASRGGPQRTPRSNPGPDVGGGSRTAPVPSSTLCLRISTSFPPRVAGSPVCCRPVFAVRDC